MSTVFQERPLLMKGPLVLQTKALIKTNTRRTKDLEEINENPDEWTLESFEDGAAIFESRVGNTSASAFIPCPYGHVGDRLWVKETFWQWGRWEADGLTKTGKPKRKFVAVGEHIIYAADRVKAPIDAPERKIIHADELWVKRSSLFMSRRASRLTLEIIGIRLERLQDISEEDAIAEGCESYLDGGYVTEKRHYYAVDDFADLWVSINGAESWNLNPWVWVLIFKVVKTG